MAESKERPILFNAEMVRAVLDGTKTVTRRVVKGVDRANQMTLKKPTKTLSGTCTHALDAPARGLCPYGQPGGRLYVRETWWHYRSVEWEAAAYADGSTRTRLDGAHHDEPGKVIDGRPWRAADYDIWRKRPSIHMPRWASRILLEVTEVRVERVQEISEEDALAEGLTETTTVDRSTEGARIGGLTMGAMTCWSSAVGNFQRLWESINGKREGCSWDDNPWCWVVSFRRIDHG